MSRAGIPPRHPADDQAARGSSSIRPLRPAHPSPSGFRLLVASSRALVTRARSPAAAGLALLLFCAATVQAQTTVKLVGNTGTTNSGSFEFTRSHVLFTTGSNTEGYVLTRVDIRVRDSGRTTNRTVTINESSAGSPGTSLGTLTNPSPYPSSWTTAQFTVPGDGIDLAADTDYIVKFDGRGSFGRETASDDEDAGGLSGWGIADDSILGGSSDGDVPKFDLYGYAKTSPTVANPMPDQGATAGTAFSYTFPAGTFNDADGDTLTYTATKSDDSALPSWLTFTASTRTFSGTPQTADVGTVSVKVTASDGTNSASDTFDIVVSATNSAPTVANPIPDRRAMTGTAFSYAFPADTFDDADGDTLTYTATQSDGTALPSWLTFTASTRTFSGTPQTADVGTVSVKVTASDGTNSASDTFDIVVGATNSAPTVGNPIPNQTVRAGRAFRYTFPANTFNDANSDTLTYTATQSDDSALPSWLTFTASTRTFTGTPTTAGTVSIKVTASDGTASASDTFDIVVSANAAPTVANRIPHQNLEVGTAFSYAFPANTFEDADGDPLTYTARQTDGQPLPGWLTFVGSTRTLSGTPPAGTVPVINVLVVASDGVATAQTWFNLNVAPPNAAPSFVSASVDGTALTITFDEALGAAPSLANEAFAVKKRAADGTESEVSLSGTPSVSGSTVVLTLASALDATDQGFSVGYTKPAGGMGNKIVDALGKETDSFSEYVAFPGAPDPVTLVSNTGQTPGSAISVGHSSSSHDWLVATAFTTGPSTGGYLISAVDAWLGAYPSGAAAEVSIYTLQVAARPTDKVATLANPSSITASAVNTFTPPSGLTLAANTRYAVVVGQEGASGTFHAQATLSNAEDMGAGFGWGIADDLHARNRKAGGWVSDSESLQIAVKGTPVDRTAPALSVAVVNRDKVTLTFDDVLQSASLANTAFTVKKTASDGTESTVSLHATAPPSVSGRTVILTLASAVGASDAGFKVGYAKPGSGTGNRIVNVLGFEAESFSGRRAARVAVSNAGEVGDRNASFGLESGFAAAQGFTTGASTDGYELGSVDAFSNAPSHRLRVRVLRDSQTGTVVATLTNPPTYSTSTFPHTFVAPSGTTLAASTTYFVVFDMDEQGVFSATRGNGEDSGGLAGWSIADTSERNGGAGWGTDQNSFRIRVAAEAIVAPTVTGVAIASTPSVDVDNDGTPETYGRGETIRVQATFSKPVAVSGTPRLKIKMDPNFGEKWAAYETGTGSKVLTFAYEVVDPNESTQGIAVLADTLALNGGTIKDAAIVSVDATLTHTGLAHDANHKVDASITDTAAPGFSSASVNGATLALVFDEDLDSSSVPAPGAFQVTVAGSRRDVASGGVAVAGTTVTLTLASAVTQGQAVTVGYTKPATNPLQDASGNDVATFSNQTVTNDTVGTQPPKEPPGGGGGGGGTRPPDPPPPPANEAPEVLERIEDVALRVGMEVEIDLSDAFHDEDDDELEYAAESSDPGVAAVEVDGETLTVRAVGPGEAEIAATAEDPDGETARQTFEVTVRWPETVWYLPPAADPARQGFVRVINHSDAAGEATLTATDDAGVAYESLALALGPRQARHFNSDDLELGNPDKGLTGATGPGTGGWRLVVESDDLDVEALAYARAADGFLTGLNAVAPREDGLLSIATFNPASNVDQASVLRLVNPSEEDAEATVTGVDDAGVSPGAPVLLELPAGSSCTVNATQLESGAGLACGAPQEGLGDGAGKWRLAVASDAPLTAMSLLSSPAGHLTNLSGRSAEDDEGVWHVDLFPAAADPLGRQGFVRVANRSAVDGRVTILAYDDSDTRYETLRLSLGAGAAAHFNSDDLELGNRAKGLTGSTGSGRGTWRLRMYSGLDIEVNAYVRTLDGFLTAMQARAPAARPGRRVATLNPGSNLSSVGVLRLVNRSSGDAEVAIDGTDDHGLRPGETVRVLVPATDAVELTAAELESGEHDAIASGALGDGAGKWRLRVASNRVNTVLSLLSSPGGHLTNLSGADADRELGPLPVALLPAPETVTLESPARRELRGRWSAVEGARYDVEVVRDGVADEDRSLSNARNTTTSFHWTHLWPGTYVIRARSVNEDRLGGPWRTSEEVVID